MSCDQEVDEQPLWRSATGAMTAGRIGREGLSGKAPNVFIKHEIYDDSCVPEKVICESGASVGMRLQLSVNGSTDYQATGVIRPRQLAGNERCGRFI